MKKILSILFLLIFSVSCNDALLDIKPTDQLTDEDVWNSPETASLFLNDIYNSLNPGPWSSIWTNVPTEISNDPLDNYSDNSMNGNAGITSNSLFGAGSHDPSNLILEDHWTNMYENIRKCNLFIEKVSSTDFEEDVKLSMLAQARFLRSYFYHSLIKWYGGIPLITEVLDRSEGEVNYPRNTYEECVAFIQKECGEAAANLPLTVPGDEEGRATKGAALALKGEVELYASKWKEAAATNWEIIQLGIYNLFPDYGALFYPANENNAEVIFSIQFVPIIRGHSRDTYWGVPQVPDGFGWGSTTPTHNLVESYEYLDGKTAAEGSALYDPANPYENKDQRFYASIIYDGSEWRGTNIYTRTGIPNNRNEIGLGQGGSNTGRTGYYMRKLLDPTVVPGRGNLNQKTGGLNHIVYRYAEILLNYAEAKNEVSGPDESVYEAINQVRNRVGLPDLPSGLDQLSMRQEIRDERRVEFALEGDRLLDLLRWRTAEEVFGQPIYGMKISEREDGKLNYEKIEVREIVFDPSKNYLMPIPQYAIDQNPELEQNPGY